MQHIGIVLSLLTMCACRFLLLNVNAWFALFIYLIAYFVLQNIVLYRLFSTHSFDPIAAILEKSRINKQGELESFINNKVNAETTKGKIILTTIKHLEANDLISLWLDLCADKVTKNKQSDTPDSPPTESDLKTPSATNTNDSKNNVNGSN